MTNAKLGMQALYADQLLETPFGQAGPGLVDPYVYDMSPAGLRQNAVNLIAKRHADMLYVTGHTRDETARLYLPDVSSVSYGGLATTGERADFVAEFELAWASRAIELAADDLIRSVTVRWHDDSGDITGRAQAVDDYGGILLGSAAAPHFIPAPLARPRRNDSVAWPLGDAVDPAARGLVDDFDAIAAPVERLFATATGLSGLLVASRERILFERYADFLKPDQAVATWSMTKAITATLIGRLIHSGWLRPVHDRAKPPLWADPRGVHALVTLDHLLRMRAGLAFPAAEGDGRAKLIFENAFAYHLAGDLFETSQRSLVAAVPGSAFRYSNTGINVLGAIVRQAIEERGLPYHQTVYELLADRIGMASYQHSADISGNFVASGSGFATLRDLAKFGVLYLQDGVWNGERLLPEGWVDYALTPTHTASPYAACFRTNSHRALPSLPPRTAWACGGGTQKILLLREAGLVMVLCSQHGHPVDSGLVDHIAATVCRL